VLVDLENLGVAFWVDDLVRKSDRLVIDGDGVQVVEDNLVLTQVGGDSKLVVGNLVSENKVSWGSGTITRYESWALRHISEVGKVIISLNSSRSNITISVDSVLHSKSLEWRES